MTSLFRSKIVVATALVLVLALLPLFGGATLAESPAMSYRAEVAEPLVVRIAPPISYPDVGETFDVEVWIDGAEDLGSFEFKMSYDRGVVHVQTAQLGDFLGSTGRTAVPLGPNIDNVAGTLQLGAFGFGSQPGPNGSGVLAIVTLEAMGDGQSGLHLHDVQVTDTLGQVQDVSTQDGSVEVSEVATATPTDTPEPTTTGTVTSTPTPTNTPTATGTATPEFVPWRMYLPLAVRGLG